jgi:hypothetical protein
MRPGLTLREDYDAARLRGVARRTKSATQGIAFWHWPKSMTEAQLICARPIMSIGLRDWANGF